MTKTAMALLLLALLAAAQEGPKKEGEAKEPPKPKSILDGPAGSIEIPSPGIEIQDASVVTGELARFQGDYKQAKKEKNTEKCAELLLKLGDKDHAKIFKEACKYVRDRDHRIATAAVVAIARQKSSADAAGKFLQRILGREKRTNVLCAALVGMGVLEYTKAYDDAKKFFVKDTRELRKAAARYFGYTKAKDAFRLLAEQLDEPIATNPNDPNNPPASWWEERWKEWKANEKAVHWALAQLVEGETFETTLEAKKWAEAHGKEHGIEW